MNSQQIKEIQKKYEEWGMHRDVMEFFNLNAAQEYAINILGRDNNLSADYLAEKLPNVKQGMTS